MNVKESNSQEYFFFDFWVPKKFLGPKTNCVRISEKDKKKSVQMLNQHVLQLQHVGSVWFSFIGRYIKKLQNLV